MLKDKTFLVTLAIFSSAVLLVLLSLVLGGLGYGEDLAFYTLSILTVVSAVGVVSSKNMVYSGFLLVLSFVSIGGIYFTLNAEFLAAIQILINGGAVTIMLIFGIWLTNNKSDTANEKYSFEYRWVVATFTGCGMFLLAMRLNGFSMYFNIKKFFDINAWFKGPKSDIFKINTSKVDWALKNSTVEGLDNTETIGKAFFNEYLVPFEVASIILLMALVGAIVLAIKDNKVATKELEIEEIK